MIMEQMSDTKHRILIVEDEESFRLVCREILRATGRYEVVTSATGEEGVAQLKSSVFDAIVLDYVLPGMSGLNVLQWMYEQKMETPVVVLTGAGTETIAVEAMKFGAYDYIPKQQFDRHHFPIVIQSIIERRAFKVEQALRLTLEMDRKKIQHTMNSMEDAVISLQQTVSNSLALISTTLEERRLELESLVSAEKKSDIIRICTDLKHQFGILALASKALSQLSTVAVKRVQNVIASADAERELRQVIHKLQEEQRSLDAEEPE
jgi:DNA-binding NarL/FixJ family response regulator